MKEFTFEGREKTVLMGFMGLGIACLIATFLFDSEPNHVRFWTNFFHNSVFFTGIAFMTLFVVAASIAAWGGWYVVFKRLWEAYSMFLLTGFVLLGIFTLAMVFDLHHIYHWADAKSVAEDEVLQNKSGFLNKKFYVIGTILFLGLSYFFAKKLRTLSIEEDGLAKGDYSRHQKMRWWAALYLPIGGYFSSVMIWQWIMSIDSHWYSTMFAWYTSASWFVSAIALSILMLIYLKSKGYFHLVTDEHIHDLGKLLFAFSIFWTYLWFDQYMLIWYGNVGEETIYFKERLVNYRVLFYANILLNFALPFLVLMRNSTKRKHGIVGFVAILVLFGHWLDFFNMVKPGALHTAHELSHQGGEAVHEAAAHGGEHMASAVHHLPFTLGFTIPGLLELGAFIGFLALFIYVVFYHLSKASLVGENDPYMVESLHHHV